MRISDWSSDVCSSDLVISHHAEKRYDKSVFTNLGVAGASILGSIFLGSAAGDLIGQVGSTAGGAYLASYSRETEIEANLIGLRLIGRVGYGPAAPAAVLHTPIGQPAGRAS